MWSWSTNVTDGQTDRQTDRQTDDMRSQYRALHYSASRGKNWPIKQKLKPAAATNYSLWFISWMAFQPNITATLPLCFAQPFIPFTSIHKDQQQCHMCTWSWSLWSHKRAIRYFDASPSYISNRHFYYFGTSNPYLQIISHSVIVAIKITFMTK